MFGAAKLTINADPDKYKYSAYGMEFDSCSEFLLADGSMGNYFITFGANMNLSACIGNKGKDFLILDEGRTQGLEDTALTAEAKYSIKSSRSQRKLCLNLHYNGSNSSLFVNATEIYQFKGNGSGIKKYTLYLGNISKDFTCINMKKTGLNGCVY